MHRSARGLAVLVILVGVLAACSRHGLFPPEPPATSVTADVVGIVTIHRDLDGLSEFTLQGGATVVLDLLDDDTPATPRLSLDAIRVSDRPGWRGRVGTLLFAARSGDTTDWYAAASGASVDCPYGLRANAVFDVGDAVLFDTGLRIPKAPGFRVLPDWFETTFDEPAFPLGAADNVCVDETGAAFAALMWMDR